MAQTKLRGYSVQQKLNKMDVDLITVIPTVSTGSTDADADLLFDSLEIPFAVSVEGGSSIIQSVSCFHKGDIDVVFDLLFFQVTQDLGSAGAALTWVAVVKPQMLIMQYCLGIHLYLIGLILLMSKLQQKQILG